MVLAVHLVQEPTKRLVWINDLALAGTRASQEQWEEAFGTAAELGLGWVLERALDYAERHLGFDRARPARPSSPPPWGPLRVGERMDGWLSYQIGQLAIGGWAGRNGYLRLAARGRGAQLRSRWRGSRRTAPPVRVLLNAVYLDPAGGSEHSLAEMAGGLAERGHNLDLVYQSAGAVPRHLPADL